MAVFTAVKTMIIACTTTPTAAIALGVPAGSSDLKGMYFRAWSDTGQIVFKLGDSGVAADKTISGGALADGNLAATSTFAAPQMLPDTAGYVSAVAQSGTPNLYFEIGTLHQ